MSVLDRFKDTEKYPRQMRELGMLIILNRRSNPGIFLKDIHKNQTRKMNKKLLRLIISLQLLITLRAISPRLAISTFLIILIINLDQLRIMADQIQLVSYRQQVF